jgi:hypothetical protein
MAILSSKLVRIDSFAMAQAEIKRGVADYEEQVQQLCAVSRLWRERGNRRLTCVCCG